MTVPEGRLPTVMIVDDTPAAIWVLAEALKGEFRTVFATSGADCLRLAAAAPPDLILLDVVMPGMDGHEVCRRLKLDPLLRDIPVIFVSALGQEEDEAKGLAIGALDYIAKPVKPAVVLARVRSHLLLRGQKAELEAKQREIEKALEAAGKIQQALLPSTPPALDRAAFAWRFEPCEAVGGDIFNVVALDHDTIGMYMLDVAGHGPPAAMISVLVYQLMNPHTGVLLDRSQSPPRLRQPEEVLDILEAEFPLERFDKHFTIVYLTVDLASGLLRYSNAAHCPPLALVRGGPPLVLDQAGTFIGLGAMSFGQGELLLTPGDKVLVYSDGLAEMEDAAERPFGMDNIEAALAEMAAAAPGQLADELVRRAKAHAGQRPLADDLSILVFEYKGPGR